MLKQLIIKNIILVESAEITFGNGFNVLSGETGSGKSAILAALGLILGDKTDTDIIRSGADKACVEAIFELESFAPLFGMLSDAGIEHTPEEDLIIRREITAAGKSRSFINNQSVQIAFLKKAGQLLIGRVNQHAPQQLFSLDHHRHILDLYGNLLPIASEFSKSWDKENRIKDEIENLQREEHHRLREMENLQADLEELEKAQLKEGEEEELFAEYSLLANSEELTQKTQAILQVLEGEKSGVLNLLNKSQNAWDALVRIDSKTDEMAKAFQTACMELKEVSYSLQKYAHHIEFNPARLEQVNERLSLINKLKRRYGPTWQDLTLRTAEMKNRLFHLENRDGHIALLTAERENLAKINNDCCAELSRQRKHAAQSLCLEITRHLRSLNMPKAEFQMEILQQKRNHSGDDKVEFYFAPNVGERLISVKECASGGELSRIMLSIQTLLAGKEQLPILVFDEIDSNIGGATAAEVGKKLREISLQHQILCITHFPQVARQADHHYQISKEEQEGRTVTQIVTLDEHTRSCELLRMQGTKGT